jgi:hypothetical protein
MTIKRYDLAGAEADRRFSPNCWRTHITLAASFTLGDATQQTLREIWNGERYRAFRGALLGDAPPACCANCGLRWSL